ncbi:MAG: Wzz/FepE/Etk N-terminal domain-containing protein [Hyphomonadaceae bacterium]|nr:Wzz/FepE/Etk N-terminal domain-containing protein [Hyphomonadaceae bacterium]
MSKPITPDRPFFAPSAVPARPYLGVAELAVQLWRAKWLMGGIFAVIVAGGVFAAMQMPTSYTASSRLLATLDDFYVYRPLAGGDAAGIALEQDQVIQAEIELLQSPVVMASVLDQLGYETAYPDIAEGRERALVRGEKPREEIVREAEALAVDALLADFEVGAAPERPIIFTAFEHRDPKVAATILNAVIETYLSYRTELFASGSGESFANQRAVFETKLAEADAALSVFVQAHGVTDIEAELGALQRLAEGIRENLLDVRARRRAAESQLQSITADLAGTPAEVDIFVEDSSQQTLMSLKLEREDLLARYTPQSQPVRAINTRIAQLEAFLTDQDAPAGTVRRGPNPVHQSLATSRATLEADLRALSGQARELERQMEEVETRRAELSALAPEWRALQRARDLAEGNVMDYATRESQAQARTELSRQHGDNIRVLEPARPPVEGSSMKLPVLAAAVLFGGFTALMAGLAYAVTRRGFATPKSLERSMAIPVLDTAEVRA